MTNQSSILEQPTEEDEEEDSAPVLTLTQSRTYNQPLSRDTSKSRSGKPPRHTTQPVMLDENNHTIEQTVYELVERDLLKD